MNINGLDRRLFLSTWPAPISRLWPAVWISKYDVVINCTTWLEELKFLILAWFGHEKSNEKGSSASQEARSDDNEEDQWSLWGRLVADWANTYKKRNAYVKDLVRKGIPHHFRGVVWPLLCWANDSPAKSQYADYIKATSACEKVELIKSNLMLL